MSNFLPEGELWHTPENRLALSSPERLAAAAAAGTVLEAFVPKCDKDYRLRPDLGVMPGVIEREEGALGVKEGSTREIALITRVGKPVQFVVTGFTTDERGESVAVCSRRLAQARCRRDYLDRLVPGDVLNAVVTHVEGFGAFCDVGAGVPALLPVDRISVSRISHPADRLQAGQKLRVVLAGRDALGRLTLSLRELLGTWEENAAGIKTGETLTGVVRSVEPYGVFVELRPNLAGLAEHTEGVEPGQGCVVYVKSMNPARMKIKLNLISVGGPAPKQPLRYFFTGDHMDRFRYSPEACVKVVETVFGESIHPLSESESKKA